ncbi:tyrosine-type recombinase/integrase [Dietzia timorensis]|uniref:Putative prophage phiRv2 integrase n=1 Tax=Dietzia timorensis TaxID=499555 RepID=A0A173LJ59_9ACTN|nr:site-specific integrase [Dietzia timorensis]ANI91664.1 Putative prophage phiRv2 integrase [Dietzia timorensis]
MAGKPGRRGWGYIRKLPSGRYQASYVAPNGRTFYGPRGPFSAKTDAEFWLASERRLIERDEWTSPKERAAAEDERGGASPLTFGQYAAVWIEQRKLKPTTRNLYRSQLEAHILPEFADRPITEIAAPEVRAWYSKLERKPARAAGNGVRTGGTRTARTYALLKTIFGTAVEDGLIESNPARIKGASQVDRRHKIEVLTPAQLDALAAAMPPQYRALVLVAAWAGLRRGEVVALRRRDIEPDGAEIHVHRAASWIRGKATIGTTKSAAGARDVTVPPHLRSVLVAHLAEHVRRGRDALVFPGSGGGLLDEWTLRYHFKAATETIGVPEFRFHDLRHQGAVYAARAGATTKELMSRLGHSTPQMSMRYQHAAQGRDAEIAERMSRMIEGE